MSAKFFLDTNVVAYAFDGSAPLKRSRARELMSKPDWVVSWQVIQEFSNLALHKFAVRMTPSDLVEYLDMVLWPHCAILPAPEIYRSATTLHSKTQYRFYDCLIVSAALASGASVLLSEDLQEDRAIGRLIIRNPFSTLGPGAGH
jgi:predicted nucleic acid-binding protein